MGGPMPHRPMPLLDFKTGIYEAQEPWRAPPGSFMELENAYVFRGQVVKRSGYELFGQLGIDEAGETIGNGGTIDVGKLANSPVAIPVSMDAADISTASIVITDGSNYAYSWLELYWDVYYKGKLGYNYLPVYQATETVLGASGSKTYSGNVSLYTNCPDYELHFEDEGGTGEIVTIDYINGYQSGPDAPIMPASGDIDPTGTNTWTPGLTVNAGGYYDITFNSVTTGTPKLKGMAKIGLIIQPTGSFQLSYIGTWNDPVTADYRYLPQDPVMGIRGFFTRDGNEYLIANDVDRIYVYNDTTKRFDDLLGAIEWTGDNSQFFQYSVFEDVCYINNYYDVPKVYDPSGGTVTDVETDFVDGSGDSLIDYASFFLRHKNRAIYFKTSESSTLYSQRARYTPVDDMEYSGASSSVDYSYLYSDAPTADQIISAFPWGDNIIVPFNRSVWMLRYSGDPNAPYEWSEIPSIDGAVARFGFIPLGEYVVFRGTDGLMATDGVSVQRFDFDIPGFTLDWNQEAKEYSYGIFVPRERQGMLTYAGKSQSLPDKVLAIQMDESSRTRSFSVFKFTNPFHCFGTWRGVGTTLWDDIGIPWDDVWWAPDSLRGVAGASIILAGDREGNIYQYPSGYTDDGTEFTAYAKFNRLSLPGMRSHVSYVEVIADAVDGGTLNLLAYEDHNPTPYLNAEIDLTPNSAYDEKVIRRVLVNHIANFHSFRMEMPGDYQSGFDQIAPYMAPVGTTREKPVSQ